MKVLIVSKEDGIDSKEILKILEQRGFNAVFTFKSIVKRDDLEGIDIVISLGGDGTALSASHYLEDKPLLAVNLNPKKSEGALTTISFAELEKKLGEIKREIKTENLERIEVFINNKKLDMLALNDVFIANEKAYLMSRYKLRFNDEEEEQKSSGLIFSTGTGSTAWFKSAGGVPFSAQSKHIKMIAREPYLRRLSSFSLVRETIKSDDKIEIEVLCPSILVIDSIREYKLREGDKVRIKISDKPLKRII